jgi:hypothetical protein
VTLWTARSSLQLLCALYCQVKPNGQLSLLIFPLQRSPLSAEPQPSHFDNDYRSLLSPLGRRWLLFTLIYLLLHSIQFRDAVAWLRFHICKPGLILFIDCERGPERYFTAVSNMAAVPLKNDSKLSFAKVRLRC